jgi:hypothetical protein
MFPVRYEVVFYISQKTAFFVVTAVKTSDLTLGSSVRIPPEALMCASILFLYCSVCK